TALAVGLLLGGQWPRLVFQQYRNAVADRPGQAVGPAQQFLPFLVVVQRALAQRAGQDGQQFLVEHECSYLGVVSALRNCAMRWSSAASNPAGSSARTFRHQWR